MEQLIGIDGVEQLVGLKKSTIYRLVQERRFPAGVLISRRSRRWPISQVQGWITEQIKEAA